MIKQISKKVAKSLCESTHNNNNVDIYEYAIYITINSAIHIISTIALGLLFNVFIESLIFYGAFIIVRKFTGGYHAKTPFRCYLFSITSITFFMFLIKGTLQIKNTSLSWGILAFAFISVILIILYAPLESVNNLPLNQKERLTYNKISVISSVSILFIACFLEVLELHFISISMGCALIMVGVVIFMSMINSTLIRKIEE